MLSGQPRLLFIPARTLPRLAISLAAVAVFGAGAVAQVATQPAGPVAPSVNAPAAPAGNPAKTAHHAGRKKSAAKVEAPVEPPPPAAPLPPPNELQQPAVPAVVTVGKDELAVRADNASLSQVLHQISSQTGMKLDGGVNGDDRVFGSFGPGAPKEVLTSLLNGAGYNLVMVGDLPNGAPRELLLSRRTAEGSAPPSANPQPQSNDNEEDNSNDFEEAPSPPSIMPAEPPPQGPGAGVPPQGRTPQQIFLEQRQQQQQQQQNPQPPQ